MPTVDCNRLQTRSQSDEVLPTTFPPHRVDSTAREVSLTAPPPTNAAGRQLTKLESAVTEEDFYSCIDAQLANVEAFTLQKVTELRANITAVEAAVDALGKDGGDRSPARVEELMERSEAVGKEFLVLEKCVNLNFMGECSVKYDDRCARVVVAVSTG